MTRQVAVATRGHQDGPVTFIATRSRHCTSVNYRTMERSQQQAQDAVNTLYEVSQILDTGLDRQSLAICVSLIERGVSPKALAEIVSQLKKERSN